VGATGIEEEKEEDSLFKNKRLSANIKTRHKILIRLVINELYLSRLGISGRHLPLKIAAPTK
jgi:hypothetical protein